MHFKSELFVFCLFLGSCSHPPGLKPPYDAQYQKALDKRPIPVPKTSSVSPTGEVVYEHGFRQLYRVIDIPAKIGSLAQWSGVSSPREADNVNEWDEVPNSTWFSNRRIEKKLSNLKLRQGPRYWPPPDLKENWKVTGGEIDDDGFIFEIVDANKTKFTIRFNPPQNREVKTRAEFLASLILSAVGYRVPAVYPVRIKSSQFELSENAVFIGKNGIERVLTQEDIQFMLSKRELWEDGTLLVTAIRHFEGMPVGPFFFEGKRSGDVNDLVSHEHRRELRAYSLFSAWINNRDVMAENTQDVYLGESGRGYLTHFFTGLDNSFGVMENRSKEKKEGYEYVFDYSEVGLNLFTLGVHYPKWESNETSGFAEIGMFESKNFYPDKWRPRYANLAFENLTDRDAFWASRIITSFTDEEIKILVDEAGYSNPKAREALTQILSERRERFREVYFNRMTPLDAFEVRSEGDVKLLFKDIGLPEGTEKPKDRSVKFEWLNERLPFDSSVARAGVLAEPVLVFPKLASGNTTRSLALKLTVENAGREIGEGCLLYFATEGDSEWTLVGLKRLSS